MFKRHTVFTRLKCTRTTEQTYGQREPTFANDATYYGTIEAVSSREALTLAMMSSEANVKIVLNNKPNLSSQDRLRDTSDNKVYWIDGIMEGFDSLIVLAHSGESSDYS